MKHRKRAPITRKRFAAWLRENPDLKFKRQMGGHCPIAVFLGAGCDHHIYVDQDAIDIDEVVFDMPPWARNFINEVDIFPGTITAQAALAFLGRAGSNSPDGTK